MVLSPPTTSTKCLWVAQQMGDFAIAVNQTPSWPTALCDSKRPSPLLYYRGDINLIESRTISIVGARKATDMGKARAAALARDLSANGITIATGLAAGIDTAAAQSAIANQGKVIGVIGPPSTNAIPKRIGSCRTSLPMNTSSSAKSPSTSIQYNLLRRSDITFPSAMNSWQLCLTLRSLSKHQILGTLTQAKACLSQGRPLFIMRSCAENSTVSWPRRYIDKEGVYVLDSTQQLLDLVYG